MSKSNGDSRRIQMAAQTSAQYAAEHLQRIVDGLHSGALTLEHRGETVCLTPADGLELRLRAKQKDGTEQLRIELSWERRPAAVGFPDLVIRDTPRAEVGREPTHAVAEGEEAGAEEEVVAVETQTVVESDSPSATSRVGGRARKKKSPRRRK